MSHTWEDLELFYYSKQKDGGFLSNNLRIEIYVNVKIISTFQTGSIIFGVTLSQVLTSVLKG